MSTIFIEPGGDATFDTSLWLGTARGAPAVATDFVHGSHLRSIKYRAANNDALLSGAGSATTTGRFSAWIYLNVLNTAVATFIGIEDNTSSIIARVRFSATNTLQLWSGSAQLGSDGAKVTSGGWHRVCFNWNITSTTVNTLVVFFDGAQTISVTNQTLSSSAVDHISIGNESSESVLDMRSSDHYLDNSGSASDVGNIWVTAKLPFSNGTTNGFTTQIGSGGSGYGSGHAPQINERALSTTNGWSQTVTGVAITEEYSIEPQIGGDISTAKSVIVDFMGWVYASSGSSETASIIVAGNSSNISLTSTNTMFEKIAGSTQYPSGNTDIGITTSTTSTTVSLYECGVVVAFIPQQQPGLPGNIERYLVVGNGMSRSEGAF